MVFWCQEVDDIAAQGTVGGAGEGLVPVFGDWEREA